MNFICNYLNANIYYDKDFIENRVKYHSNNNSKIGHNYGFKIQWTNPASLNDLDLSRKLSDNVRNNLTYKKSNNDLIKTLQSKLIDELIPHTKTSL